MNLIYVGKIFYDLEFSLLVRFYGTEKKKKVFLKAKFYRCYIIQLIPPQP